MAVVESGRNVWVLVYQLVGNWMLRTEYVYLSPRCWYRVTKIGRVSLMELVEYHMVGLIDKWLCCCYNIEL